MIEVGVNETVESAEEVTTETIYTKEQILKSKKYREKRDLINALLVNGRSYMLTTVDDMIEKFLKGEVK